MNMKCLLTTVLVIASRLLLFAQSDVTNELITNSGFENGINNGWTLVVNEGAASFSDAGSSESVSGNSAGKVEVTTAPSGGSAVLKIYLENELKDATAYAGKTLTYSFKAKASWTYAGSSFTKIMPRVDDQNGNNLASIEKWFTGSNEDVYQDVSIAVNVPVGTTELRFYVWLGAYKASYTLDDFTVTCAECQGSSKIDQTISFSSLSEKTVGDPSFDLSATASSMLAVSYTSSNTNVATISGSTVTVVGEGTTTISASQAGDATYNAAPNVTQNLTVNAADPIDPPTGGDLTKYEAEDATKSGDISFNQGWRMDNPSNGDCAYFNDDNGSSLEFTVNVADAGNYDLEFVYATVSAATVSKLVVNSVEVETIAWPYTGGNFKTTLNYTTSVALSAGSNTIKVLHDAGWLCIDYMGGDGDDVVTKTPQTITFNTLGAVEVGDPAFALTATASSNLSVSYVSSNTNVATVSGNTVTIVAEGTTTITASQAGNSEFEAAPNVTRQLVVNEEDVVTKTPQTITFNSLGAKKVGDPSFTLSATASSNLSVSYVSSNTNVATVSGNTVTIKAKGTTSITASQAGNNEFEAAPNVTRQLVVNDNNGTVDAWTKLMKGVNQSARTSKYNNVPHERLHIQTMKDAGFEAVRIFIPYESSNSFTSYQDKIQDALDFDMAIVLCMWGPNGWNNSSQAESQISKRWKETAQWVEATWPGEEDIVFELLNEPAAIGFPLTSVSGHLKAMKLYGAAAKAVREVSATRKILISPSGFQDADLMEHVTVQNVGYDFTNDDNCGISIHFYKPSSATIGWFAMNEYPLNDPSSDLWRAQIREEVQYVLDWREEKHVPNMPIVVTEWGCWNFPDREERGDLKLVAEYTMDIFRQHNIGSTWYTGMQSNQRAFGIFDSEFGWNNTVVKAITGQNAPSTWPSTNQFVDAEFEDFSSKTWKRLDGQGHTRVQFTEALSGNAAIKLSAPATIYQRSFVGKVSDNLEVGENIETRLGKYLLHLVQGKTYKISFMAKADAGTATLVYRMKENLSSANGTTIINQTGATYYTSPVQNIGTSSQTFELIYTHTGATAMDVWAEFEVTSGTITFDAVDFRQSGGTNSNAREISNDLGLEQALEEMLVYPNPSSNLVHISHLKEGASLQVINSVGKIVLLQKVNSEKVTLDISKLNKGIYFIRSGASTSKLIVE